MKSDAAQCTSCLGGNIGKLPAPPPFFRPYAQYDPEGPHVSRSGIVLLGLPVRGGRRGRHGCSPAMAQLVSPRSYGGSIALHSRRTGTMPRIAQRAARARPRAAHMEVEERQHFGRRVDDAAGRTGRPPVQRRRPEVAQLKHATLHRALDERVFGLQVAVADALVMAVSQCFDQLREEILGLLNREPAPSGRQDKLEKVRVAVLKNHKRRLGAVFHGAVQRDHVRVSLHSSQSSHFDVRVWVISRENLYHVYPADLISRTKNLPVAADANAALRVKKGWVATQRFPKDSKANRPRIGAG